MTSGSPGDLIEKAFAPSPPERLGVAVSGGGDSMALLHLLAGWAGERGVSLAAVTVNHGLRAEAADEAAMVATTCRRLGIPHDVMDWRWEGMGNLPDQARRGRYALISIWAHGRGIGDVALGHTADDQAETLMMRLMRGSGVDGLSAMAATRRAQGLVWHRPLLAASRESLRAWLRAARLGWCDDPTNDDPAFDRVRVRQALDVLGLDRAGLVETADRMRMAREALEHAALDLARRAARVEAGDVVIAAQDFWSAPEDARLRLLAHALRWIASAEYRPRFAALRSLSDAARAGRGMTLGGCQMDASGQMIRLAREYHAIRQVRSAVSALWDGRWQLKGPESPAYSVACLGEAGLSECADWRLTGLPRRSLLASPAVWDGDKLIAAPLAGAPNGWTATLASGEEAFYTTLITH